MGKQITDIKVVQSICLDMAKEMHRILTKYNIPYYMLYGTLLGSVRHKGFIPWDDDMDFGIPRKYFWQAISLLQKELKSPYKCVSYRDSDVCLDETCKIMNMTTRIKQEDIYGKDVLGVFIDIFPIDYSNGNMCIFSRFGLIRNLVRLQHYRFTHVKGRSRGLKFLSYLIKIFFFSLHRETIPHLIGTKLILQSGKFMYSYCGMWGKRELNKVETMENTILMPFENTKFYGLLNFNSYLTTMYGDYMQLPPKEKRHIHLVSIEYI